MLAKIATTGALLALILTAGTFALDAPAADAAKKTRPACCANHPSAHAKCCATGKKEACCHSKSAKGVTAVCGVTGKPLARCCGSKASQMPPCCQKGCKTAGKVVQ